MSAAPNHSKIARSPLLAILAALVFMTGALPTPLGDSIVDPARAQTTGLIVTSADYETEVDEIFGEKAYAYLVLTHEASDTTEQRDVIEDVKVSSPTAATDLLVDLLETGPETGVFYGGFGFSTTGNTPASVYPFIHDDGVKLGATTTPLIHVKDGDQVSVTTTGGSTSFKWFAATDGSFGTGTLAAGTVVGTVTPIAVVIDDGDLDQETTSAESYTDRLFVRTDSDPDGRFLTITETGDNTGTFSTSIQLRTQQTPGAGQQNSLFVRPGDAITATYQDTNDASGLFAERTRTWTFQAATNGQVLFDRATYIGDTQPVADNGLDRAVVTVIDGDPNQGARPDTVSVDVFADTPGGSPQDCVRLELRELPGPNAGVATPFTATLKFDGAGAQSLPASCPTGDTLQVRDGQTLRAVYSDNDRQNNPTTRETTATWRAAATATVTLGPSSTATILRGTQALFNVEVSDTDSNRNPNVRDTITVTARSDTSPSGLAISLLETGTNTGRFSATLQFTTSGTSGRLGVTDGDLITVEYNDPVTATGKDRIIQANGGRAVFWRADHVATIFTDETLYMRHVDGTDIARVADIFVEDLDRNNPTRRDSVTVTAFAQPPTGTGDQVTLTLDEVGLDSGLFHGVLRFEDTDSSPSLLAIKESASVSERDFVVEYTDEVIAGTTTRTASTGTLTFVNDLSSTSEAIVRLENDNPGRTLTGNRTADTVFGDPDATNGDQTADIRIVLYAPNQGASVVARLESTICNEDAGTGNEDEHRDVTLTQTGPDMRYEGDFVVSLDDNLACEDRGDTPTFLGAEAGKPFWINVTLTDGTLLSTQVTTRSVAHEAIALGAAPGGSGLEDTQGLNTRAFVQITGADHNYNSETRQVFTFDVTGRPTSTGAVHEADIVAVETAPNSGVFRTAFGFVDVDGAPVPDFSGLQKVGVENDVKITGPTATVGRGLYSGVEIVSRDALWPMALSWWPASQSTLTVDREAFGTQGFRLLLTDRDGFAERIEQEENGVAEEDKYDFDHANFVRGSELVFIRQSATISPPSTGSGPHTSTFSRDNDASEPLADFDGDGQLGCGDVDLSGTRDQNGGLPGGTSALDDDDIVCESLTLSGTTYSITYNFEDRDGAATCSHNVPPTTSETCQLVVGFYARAQAKTACASGDDRFVYVNTATGVDFCADQNQDMIFSYIQGTRVVKVQSRATAAGAVLETETVPLEYDVGRSGTTPTFSGVVGVQTSASANDDLIAVTGSRSTVQFAYAEPVSSLDGGPGSDTYDNARAVRARDDWRAAQSAKIEVIKRDLSGPASLPVLGPAIFVEVVDSDSDLTPQQDAITLTAADSTNGAESVSLTLRETSGTSAIFRGILQVSAGAVVNGDNVLQFGATSGTIRFSFADPHLANGVAQTVSKNVDWRDAETARIVLSDDSSIVNILTTGDTIDGTLGRLFVRVEDSDANRNSGVIETIEARVRSTYDPVGETITLTETAPNSEFFVSSGVAFETTKIEGNGKVFTRDFAFNDPAGPGVADEVFVTYEDKLDVNGDPVTIDSGTQTVGTAVRVGWDERFDGLAELDLGFYIGTNVTGGVMLAEAHLTVTEGDSNTDPRKVDVLTLGPPGTTPAGDPIYELGRLVSGNIPSPVELESLVETGANTGVFIGAFSFADIDNSGTNRNEAQGTSTQALIAMANTESLRFIYRDTKPASGSSTAIFDSFDTAQWYVEGYGILGFDRAGYNDIDVPAVLRLYDSDLTSGTSITVTSDADADGEPVTLSSKRDGVFEGSLPLRDADGTGLLVNDIDELVARYSDSSPPGVREARADVRIDDFAPPVTTVVTSPATPDGENGWFITQPTITFDANEPIQNTFFKLDGGATRQFSGGFTVNEGLHTLEYWSIDSVGNEEDPKETDIKFDATAPDVEVDNLTARSVPAGGIQLSWSPAPGKTDPLEFGNYIIYQSTTANKVGNVSTETFTHTPSSDGTHTYLVAVADAAGNVDPGLAVSVTGISDRVAPRLENMVLDRNAVFEELDDDLTVTITATVNPDDLNDLDRVEASILNPFGESAGNVTLSREGTTEVWRGTFDDFTVSGNYTFQVSALDVAGNADTLSDEVRFVAIDKEAPRVSVPATVVQGTPLSVVVTDNDRGIATISYRLDGGAVVNVPVSGGPKEHTFTIPTGALALGPHTLVIDTQDLNESANFASYTETFTVTDSTGTGVDDPITQRPTISVGSSLIENGGDLTFLVQSQGPLTALTVAFGDETAEAVLSSWSNSATPVRINVGDRAPGEHIVEIVAVNAAGSREETASVYILEPGVPLPPGSVQVTEGKDGFPKITWTASPSSNVGGYLVHRSSSPFKVIAVLDAAAREFTDTTAKENTEYQYAVTAYGSNGEGQLDEGADSESQLPWLSRAASSSFTVGEPDSNFWTIFWVVLILLVVIAAVVLLVVFREQIFKDRGDDDGYDEEYPDEAGAAAAGFADNEHELRCPNCTTEFSVTGEKPIVTTCPNCGKKGILR